MRSHKVGPAALDKQESTRRTSTTKQYKAVHEKRTEIPDDVLTNHLIDLDMEGNLIASLPPNFSALTHLTSLNLSGNMLTSMPDSISCLSLLESCYISHNKLSNIPATMGELQYLQSLDVSHNFLSALPDSLSRLKELQEFIMIGNPLLDHLVPLYERYDFIESKVSLTDAHDYTELPSQLSCLIPFQCLDLSRRPDLHIPTWIDCIKGLISISLQECHFTCIPTNFETLPSVKCLDLSKNEIFAENLDLSAFPNLEELTLTDNPLHAFPKDIHKLSSLTKLVMARNQIAEVTDDIRKMEYLQHVNLEANELSSFPEVLTHVSSITFLNLAGNRISLIPESIREMKRLKKLDLSQNKFTDYLFQHGLDGIDKELPIPPAICELDLEIDLFMNTSNDVALLSQVQNHLSNRDLDCIQKALFIANEFKKSDSCEDEFSKEYEKFAIAKITTMPFLLEKKSVLMSKRNTEDKTEKQILGYIGLGIKFDARLFLSCQMIQHFLQSKWTNDCSFRKILLIENKASSYWNLSVSDIVIGASSFLRNHIGDYLSSIRTKFYMSFLLYLLYVSILTIVVVSRNSSGYTPIYYFTKFIEDTYSVDSVTSQNDMWDYLGATFTSHYEGYDEPPPSQGDTMSPLYDDSYFKVIGDMRLRQIRVKPQACRSFLRDKSFPSEDDSQKKRAMCIPSYDGYNYDTNPYGPNSTYQWASESEAKSPSTLGVMNRWYPGYGHIYIVHRNPELIGSQVQVLQQGGFVDNRTRALFLEFFVANDNIDAIAYVQVLFEFPATMGILGSLRIQTVRSPFAYTTFESISIYEWIILIYTVGFIAHEIKQLKIAPNSYFDDMWNLFDVVMIGLLVVIAALRAYSIYLSYPIGEMGWENGTLLNLTSNFVLFFVVSELLAVLSFLSWIRLFFYIGLLKSVGPMQIIAIRMIDNLKRFLIILVIVLLGFASAYYCIFGNSLESFATLSSVFYSLGLMLFGDVDFNSLDEKDPVMAPLFVFLFLVSCSVLLLNFLIAILSGTYEDIRNESESQYVRLFAYTVYSVDLTPPPVPFNLINPLRPYFVYTYKWSVKAYDRKEKKSLLPLNHKFFNQNMKLMFSKTKKVSMQQMFSHQANYSFLTSMLWIMDVPFLLVLVVLWCFYRMVYGWIKSLLKQVPRNQKPPQALETIRASLKSAWISMYTIIWLLSFISFLGPAHSYYSVKFIFAIVSQSYRKWAGTQKGSVVERKASLADLNGPGHVGEKEMKELMKLTQEVMPSIGVGQDLDRITYSRSIETVRALIETDFMLLYNADDDESEYSLDWVFTEERAGFLEVEILHGGVDLYFVDVVSRNTREIAGLPGNSSIRLNQAGLEEEGEPSSWGIKRSPSRFYVTFQRSSARVLIDMGETNQIREMGQIEVPKGMFRPSFTIGKGSSLLVYRRMGSHSPTSGSFHANKRASYRSRHPDFWREIPSYSLSCSGDLSVLHFTQTDSLDCTLIGQHGIKGLSGLNKFNITVLCAGNSLQYSVGVCVGNYDLTKPLGEDGSFCVKIDERELRAVFMGKIHGNEIFERILLPKLKKGQRRFIECDVRPLKKTIEFNIDQNIALRKVIPVLGLDMMTVYPAATLNSYGQVLRAVYSKGRDNDVRNGRSPVRSTAKLY